jgi:hypothetical protein
MLLNSPTFPTFYTFNDVARKSEGFLTKAIDLQKQINNLQIAFVDQVTDGYFTTYTKKATTFNENMAEDAKKFIQTGTNTVSKDSK